MFNDLSYEVIPEERNINVSGPLSQIKNIIDKVIPQLDVKSRFNYSGYFGLDFELLYRHSLLPHRFEINFQSITDENFQEARYYFDRAIDSL